MFTKEQVFKMCEKIAPKYNFEIELIQALCLQEGGRNKDGSFAPDRARLEQGFYSRYVLNQLLPTTVEILMSASYGVTQTMGQSLKELGFFEWYFNLKGKEKSSFALSQFNVPMAIDEYCTNLEWQIEWGCRWLDRKRRLANGDIPKTLSYWNGDKTGKYAAEVLEKYQILKK